MSDQRGVFTLRTTNLLRRKEQWVDLNTVWNLSPQFADTAPNSGYYAGGESPSGFVSTVERVDFTTDTLSPSPARGLASVRFAMGGTGNSTDGYFGGGYDIVGNNYFSDMEKVTYSTDDTLQVPGANLLLKVAGSAASGNQTNGYFGGGYDGDNSTNVTSFTKIQYSDDTRIPVPTTNLSLARNDLSAMGNESSGYFIGGRPGPVSIIDKLVYSIETCFQSPSLQYPESYRLSGAVGNPAFGMVAGGRADSLIYDTVNKLDYSTDNFSSVPGLPVSKFGVASFGNSTDAYFGGGRAVPAVTSDFVKIQYSTSTYSPVPNLNLSSARYLGASSGARSNGLSNFAPNPIGVRYRDGVGTSPNTGYFSGGTPSSAVSTVDKIDFSTDRFGLVPGANLTTARGGHAATGNSTHGYLAGGSPGTLPTEKINYFTDTTANAATSANLGVNISLLGATGNTDAGYFAGGLPATAQMRKITYVNDNVALSPGANLSVSRYYVAATGNSDEGYFAGGQPGAKTTVDKISYSTDTRVPAPSALLVTGRYAHAATGNSTHGYFVGGANQQNDELSTMEKIDYSTSSPSPIPQSNLLSIAKRFITATGNSTHGYIGGGSGPNNSDPQSVDKLDYTTSTVSVLPSISYLSANRTNIAANGARAHGLPVFEQPTATPSPAISVGTLPTRNESIIAGGEASLSDSSRMDKMFFADDTNVDVPTMRLTSSRHDSFAIGNGNACYFAGGDPYTSRIEKAFYSVDLSLRIPNNLLGPKEGRSGVGNTTNGYFGGGYEGSPSYYLSTVEKFRYSDDTVLASPGVPNMPTDRGYGTSLTNQTHGYFMGGRWSFLLTRVDKLEFSNDTAAFTPGLNSYGPNRLDAGATGNSTKGYYAGGDGRSDIERITYTVDTFTEVPGGKYLTPSSSGRGEGVTATGNSTHAYFIGGGNFGSDTVQKLGYVTETMENVPNFSRSLAKAAAAGTREGGLPTTSTGPFPNSL